MSWKPRQTIEMTSPHPPAPAVNCPTCDRPLAWLKTIIGGVQPAERWDVYQCNTCYRSFEFRHRTGQLREADTVR